MTASKHTGEPAEAAPQRPLGGVTMAARLDNVIAHVDPDAAPAPLFAPRTETSS
jgi:hypothetical protein